MRRTFAKALYNRPVSSIALLVGVLFLLLSVASFVLVWQDNRYLYKVSSAFYNDGESDADNAIQLAHYVATTCKNPVDPAKASFRAKLEEWLPLNLSPVTILKEGYGLPYTERFGPCGSMSQAVAALGDQQGVEWRMVMLDMGGNIGEHKMVALKVDGEYRLFDPTVDHYWTNKDGGLASVDEIRSDPEIFAQVFEKRADYPYRFDDIQYFRWERLKAPGRWLKRALTAVKGEEWVAQVDTPELIDRPIKGYAWASVVISLPLLGWAWRAKRWRAKEARYAAGDLEDEPLADGERSV
jgi:hypothetical protein